MDVEQRWNDIDRVKTEAHVENPVPASLFLPQISQGLVGNEMGFCGERLAIDRLSHGTITER